MTKYVAIGSAHLDVLARSEGDPKGIDQPGTAKIEVGGTACNVAINWAKLGLDARLLTITDGGALSTMVANHVKKQKVDVVLDHSESVGVGIFSAHLNNKGELVSAVSHMPISNHHFSDEAYDQALADAHYVLLDCNLSPEELSAASIECLARAIPFAIAGVSEEKSLKLNNVRSMPTLVSLNNQEASYFLQKILKKKINDPIERICILSDHLRCPCIMTMGAEGAIYYDGKAAPIWDKPEKSAAKGNRLGAGDGFLAAFIHAMDVVSESNPRAALNRAIRIATILANREHSNLGSAKPLDQAFDELGTKAYKDPLTGWANRAGAQAGLEQRKNDGATYPMAVLLMDIDYFKKVNDTLGHDQGDVAIKEISALAMACMRTQDIASRWGGEEFLCFLPQASENDGYQLAERIRRSIESTEILRDWPLTVSIGVSMATSSADLDPAIKRADLALYEAKHAGRNQVSIFKEKSISDGNENDTTSGSTQT